MRLFYDPHIEPNAKSHELSVDESKHIVRVLRMNVGDELGLLDGLGNFYSCVLTESSKKCLVRIEKRESKDRTFQPIHIAIAPTKQNERMEWFVEKVTEIGVDEITFIKTKNSERTTLKIDRLERKAISAMKQSNRWFLPKINKLTDINSFIQANPNGLIAHCNEGTKTTISKEINQTNGPILIGPEGDFTFDELNYALDNGYKSVNLGDNRLRTETAGIVACTEAVLNLA